MVQPIVKVAALAAVMIGATRSSASIDILFDYSLDTSGFFTPQARQDALEAAANVFESLLQDDLDAIAPGTIYNEGTQFEFSDQWDAIITHPSTGAEHQIPNLIVPADTLIVYVGGYALPNDALGQGGPGGRGPVTGIESFGNSVTTRGEPGDPQTDFGPWGGFVSFDTLANWHFEIATGPPTDQSDFFSIALHELGHLLGLGTAESWNGRVQTIGSTHTFVGPASVAAHAGNVPLHDDRSHWAEDTMGLLPSGASQQAAMTPGITPGVRTEFTRLDYAALIDVGWELTIPTASPLPGDANNDRLVTGADLIAVQQNFGTVEPGAPTGTWGGDANDDGQVTGADLIAVQQNFGAAAATGHSVPEPVTL